MDLTHLKRTYAYAITFIVAVAILCPIAGDPRSDSFPLSTFPMFSGRQSPNAAIPHVIAFDADGKRTILPPAALSTDEVIQAFETVRQAVAQGDRSTDALCEEAAAWASGHRAEVRTVAVVTDTFDAIAYFDGEKAPQTTTTHATCEVPAQ